MPESIGPGKSYFQVELAGEVYDSPHFSVLSEFYGGRLFTVVTDIWAESIQQPSAVSSPRPPAISTAQELKATMPLIEFVTHTIVMSIPSSCEFHYVPIQ